MTFTMVSNEITNPGAKIKVIGVGGAGGNAVNGMIDSKLQGVHFIAANTDSQALDVSKATTRIQLGRKLTEGLGAGASPEKGRQAAEESAEEIKSVLEDSHMVFVAAGCGGGTGTGAAPVIAKICKELGTLTVAVVSKPFSFEGRKRMAIAEGGIRELNEIADTVITIPNNRLLGLAPRNARMIDMFKKANEILLHSVKGITDLIITPGLVNLDFADIKTTMSKAGMAIMGIGVGTGDSRAVDAANKAIAHPLLEDISIAGAKGVLMNITSNSDLTMEETQAACERIHKEVGEDAEIIWGTVLDDSVGDELLVTVIATGIGNGTPREQLDYDLEMEGRKIMEKVASENTVTSKVHHLTRSDDAQTSRRQNAAGSSDEKIVEERPADVRQVIHKGLIDDQEDLDIPTFLRRGAD